MHELYESHLWVLGLGGLPLSRVTVGGSFPVTGRLQDEKDPLVPTV